MAKQTFTTGQVLTAAQMTSLQQTAMGGGAATAKTTSYVLTAADAGTVVQMNAAGATTITVNTALFAAGDSVQIQNIGAGVCTVTAGTATVTTAGSLALSQWEGGNLYFTSTSASIFFDIVQSSGMTNPMTTTGDTIYSSSGSTPARLGIGTSGQVLTVASGIPSWATPASGSTFVGVALSKTNSTSFTSPNYTVIPWNNEQFDTNTFHDNTTNNTRITIPSGKAGYYLITAQATISSANTSQSRQLTLWKNGSLASSEYGNVNGYYNGVGQDYSLNFSYTVNLAVGDYLEVKYYQNSGVTIPCDQYNNLFTATYLGA